MMHPSRQAYVEEAMEDRGGIDIDNIRKSCANVQADFQNDD